MGWDGFVKAENDAFNQESSASTSVVASGSAAWRATFRDEGAIARGTIERSASVQSSSAAITQPA